MAKIERDAKYGDFKAIERLNKERQLFRAECVRCGASKRFKADTLAAGPLHDCDDKVKAINSIRRSLSLSEYEPGSEEGEEEETVSLFAENVSIITDLLNELEEGNGTPERKYSLSVLKMMIDLVPTAERTYREKPTQAHSYALNGLLSQIRELVNDLKGTDDNSALIESILNKILQPAFLSMGQVLIDNVYALRRKVESSVDPAKTRAVLDEFDDMLKDTARSFQATFYDVQKRVGQELQ